MEAEYVTTFEAIKEVIWLQKFLMDLETGLGKGNLSYCIVTIMLQ